MVLPKLPSLPPLLSHIDPAILESTRKAIEDLAEVFHKQEVEFAKALEGIGRSVERTYPRMETAADRLGALGWTIPMGLSLRVLVSLADADVSEVEVHRALNGFYTENNFEELRKAEVDLLGSPLLAPWKELLQESFCAFYQRMYQVPVPALLAVIEGIVASETGNSQTTYLRVRQMAKEQSERLSQPSVESLIWRSGSAFVDNLFAHRGFSQEKPLSINRHWILHGRDAGPWEKTDAVRLFGALHTLT